MREPLTRAVIVIEKLWLDPISGMEKFNTAKRSSKPAIEGCVGGLGTPEEEEYIIITNYINHRLMLGMKIEGQNK